MIAGGELTSDELDGAIPDARELEGSERAAWQGLSHWADDDDVREKDPAYGSARRRQLCDLLYNLDEG